MFDSVSYPYDGYAERVGPLWDRCKHGRSNEQAAQAVCREFPILPFRGLRILPVPGVVLSDAS